MLFFKFFVCLQICVIINGSRIPFFSKKEKDSFQKQLVDAIYKYDEKTQILKSKTPLNGNELISEEVFNYLGNQIYFILKEMYYYYISKYIVKMPCYSEEDNKSENKHKIIMLSEFEMSICVYIPRCVDFIFICAPQKRSIIYKIGKILKLLCNSFPTLIAQICTVDKDNNRIYLCTNESVNILRNKIQSVQKLDTGFPEKNYQGINEIDFLREVFTCINNIDKTNMMINSKPPTNINIFRTVKHDYHDRKIDLYKLHDRVNKIDKLIEQFKNVNINLIASETLNKCSSIKLFNDTQSNQTIILTVRKFLSHILKNLKNYFNLNMIQFFKNLNITDESLIDHDLIEVWMSNMFDGICKYIPLSLLYLTENGILDTELFSMYLTFCDDIMGFIFSHCPNINQSSNSSKVQHSVNCIIESIKDKLLWNFYISNIISQDNKSINNNCAVLYFNYIKRVYNSLVEYYDGLSVDVWTTFDFLSGKNFLTKESYNIKINKIKEIEITISDVKLTLSEVYYLILPLNSNMNTLLIFHNIILFYLDDQFNFYVYRHVIAIILYFDYTNVSETVLSVLKRSLNWYKSINQLFYKYLSLPVKHETRDHIITLISEIENISKDTLDKIRMFIPKNIYNKIFLWSKSILIFSKNRYVIELNNLVMGNCLEAMEFLNAVMLIVHESLSSHRIIGAHDNLKDINNNINNDTRNVYDTYCINSVSNIFVEVKSNNVFNRTKMYFKRQTKRIGNHKHGSCVRLR